MIKRKIKLVNNDVNHYKPAYPCGFFILIVFIFLKVNKKANEDWLLVDYRHAIFIA